MKFTEAFEALGYRLDAPRQDWSAEKDGGVCISIWKEELQSRDGLLWLKTQLHGGPLHQWQAKAGNRKRTRHLRRALDQFDGRVDVVIVSGTPGVGYGTAQPWLGEGTRACTWWQVTELDDTTGHFELVLRQDRSSLSAQ